MKPEDAKPIHGDDIRSHGGKLGEYFTAAECAQIARRMRVLQEDMDCAEMGSHAEKSAAREILDWEQKFTEWTKGDG